jgi:hypothetical protein
MSKKRIIIFAGPAILLVLGVAYLWGPASVPPGQEPLFTLSTSTFSEFEEAFDANADVPRLVLLLSPT